MAGPGAVTPQLTSDDLLERYRAEVDELCADQGLKLVDVARIHHQDGAEAAEREAKARATFLEEHRHAEDEVRFFAHGTGCFYLHLQGQVFAVVCTAGDLLSVPAGTRHWFDMGPEPEFAAIRFFEKDDAGSVTSPEPRSPARFRAWTPSCSPTERGPAGIRGRPGH